MNRSSVLGIKYNVSWF